MEYIVGPVLALMLSLKFTQMKANACQKKVRSLEEEFELVLEDMEDFKRHDSKRDEEYSKKVLATLMPVAKAVQKLNQTVGI
jgi:cell wall assembly regulator SMI1